MKERGKVGKRGPDKKPRRKRGKYSKDAHIDRHPKSEYRKCRRCGHNKWLKANFTKDNLLCDLCYDKVNEN